MWNSPLSPLQTAVHGAAPIAARVAVRRPFRVAAFGLGSRFLNLVDMIFRSDDASLHRYDLVDTRSAVEFDIALVNLTVPGGVDTARRLRSLPSAQPVIGIGRRSNRLRGADDLLFASFARDIIAVLNRAADSLIAREQSRAILKTTSGSEPVALTASAVRRVLVIDPSPSSRRQVAVGMRQLGIEAEGVGSLEQATAALSTRSYDLIIVDPAQPDGCGLRMLRRYKRATGSRVPIVVLSASSRLPDLLRGAMAGCKGYLVKPLSTSVLQTTVRRILLGKRFEAEARSRAGNARLVVQSGSPFKLSVLLPWRIMKALQERCFGCAGGARRTDRDYARQVINAARRRAKAEARNRAAAVRHGDGARIDSRMLSPHAIPIWRPGGMNAGDRSNDQTFITEVLQPPETRTLVQASRARQHVRQAAMERSHEQRSRRAAVAG